jgi:DNA-binding NarL/FixJ family response regulator
VNANSTIRVLVADDHPVMRDGLCAAIDGEMDMEVVAQAFDGVEAVACFRELRPDVALLDLQMPNLDGHGAIAEIREEFTDAVIVVLTTYPVDARVTKAMELGATSYLPKSAQRSEILGAIRAAANGQRTLAPEIERDLRSDDSRLGLTSRELAVLRLVAAGNSNKLIATELFISEETVKTRMKAILAKLGAEDRAHAVTIAVRRGFIE